jgi:hypothetical protein
MDAPIGPKAGRITADAHRVGVEIDLSELSGRLEREAMRLITDLSQQGLSGDELADRVAAGLMNLSDTPIQEAARGAASESFNLGRNLGAQEAVDQIATVVRTEVLDQNTCPPCERLDYDNSGTVYEMNSPEYFRDMPPNQCDGRDLCRGFYLYLTGEPANA